MPARLAILSLRLAEFRSWATLSLDPGGAPLALTGANGAGKTNVLEALSLLSPGRGLRRAEPADLARRPGPGRWRARFRLAAPGGLHEIATGAGPDGLRTVEIDGKPATQIALARIFRVLWLTPAMDRLWTEGAADRRRFLDRVTMSFLPGHAEATIAWEKAMRERNRLIRDDSRDLAWFDALEARMAGAGAAIAANRAEALRRLEAAQDGAATAFPRARLALTGPEGEPPIEEEAELRAALLRSRPRDRVAGRALSGPHRDDLSAVFAATGTDARLCSTGEQKALLVSLVLANARALARETGAPPVLLLDEVAAHFDDGRRRALFAEIEALGAQAFMTGTEPGLFSAARIRRVAVAAATPGASVLAPPVTG